MRKHRLFGVVPALVLGVVFAVVLGTGLASQGPGPAHRFIGVDMRHADVSLASAALTAGALSINSAHLGTGRPATRRPATTDAAPGDFVILRPPGPRTFEALWSLRAFEATPATPPAPPPTTATTAPPASAAAPPATTDSAPPATAVVPTGTSTPAGGVWSALRQCESGGNYSDDTGNGYYGAYQFSLATWRHLGLGGLPSEAAPAVQDDAAHRLEQSSGWGQWPECSRLLHLL